MGMQAIQFLMQTFNAHEFVRQNIDLGTSPMPNDVETVIADMFEKRLHAENLAKWERKVIRKQQRGGDLSQVHDVLEDAVKIAERRDEYKQVLEKATENLADDAKQPMPYKLSSMERQNIQSEFHLKDGIHWSYFSEKNTNVWPMTIKTNTSTSAKTVGGFEVEKSNGEEKKQWTPGDLQIFSILAYDEARSILSGKDIEVQGLFLSLLNDSTTVETKARKDRDESGNDQTYPTFTSLMTGTTEYAGLNDLVAMGGFMQRFLFNYRKVSTETAKKICYKLAGSSVTPEERWSKAKAYYDAFTQLKINYGLVRMTPAATAAMNKCTDENFEYSGKYLGVGTHTHEVAVSFNARRTTMYIKCAGIMAALDNLSEIQPEHIELVHQMVGRTSVRAIADFLEDCIDPASVAYSAKKFISQSDIITAMLSKLQSELGNDYVTVDILTRRIMRGGPALKWPSENKTYFAICHTIESWAEIRYDVVDSIRDSNENIIKVRKKELPDEIKNKDDEESRRARETLEVEQGGVSTGWGKIAIPVAPPVVAPPEDAVDDLDDDLVKQVRKRKRGST